MNDIQRALAALHTIPPNLSRDQWHKVGRAALAAGLSIDDVIQWSEPADNFKGRKDVEAAFRTVKPNGGTGAGTLFHFAKQYGFNAKSAANNSHPMLSLTDGKIIAPAPVKQAASAVNVWNLCIPATNAEPYIYCKQGKPDGLRVYPAANAPPLFIGQGDDRINAAGGLVVPCWDGDTLQTLQIIPLEGSKKNLPLSQFGNGFFTVDTISDRAFICEGIATAWACNTATGAAAVVCFGSGRIDKVAKVLRKKYPAARLVVVADRGKESQAAEIAAAVAGQWVEMPNDKPSNYDANDYLQEAGADALTALLEHPQAPRLRFKLLSGADLCNAPPMRWLVRGVLPTEGLAALYGASGSGKGFLILDMAADIAGGVDWFGRRVTQAPVTYICLEGEAGLGKRVKAWSLHHNRPVPEALRFVVQSFALLSDDVAEIAKAIVAAGGANGLVILDTLNRAAPGADENSSMDMGNLIAAAKELQTLIGGLVLLVHHTGKDATKGLRGHSSLFAALDSAIEVINTDLRRTWSVAKSKDDVTGDAYPFKLEIVQVGIDDQGDEITSCVIVPDESGEAIQRKRPSLGKNQKIARDVLGEPLRRSPHTGKEGAPAGRPCITYDEAVAIVAERMPPCVRIVVAPI